MSISAAQDFDPNDIFPEARNIPEDNSNTFQKEIEKELMKKALDLFLSSKNESNSVNTLVNIGESLAKFALKTLFSSRNLEGIVKLLGSVAGEGVKLVLHSALNSERSLESTLRDMPAYFKENPIDPNNVGLKIAEGLKSLAGRAADSKYASQIHDRMMEYGVLGDKWTNEKFMREKINTITEHVGHFIANLKAASEKNRQAQDRMFQDRNTVQGNSNTVDGNKNNLNEKYVEKMNELGQNVGHFIGYLKSAMENQKNVEGNLNVGDKKVLGIDLNVRNVAQFLTQFAHLMNKNVPAPKKTTAD